jgi:DNA polymerase-3 subunit alpha
VAQIITFGTMKAKAAVRDVGRALDIAYADVDKVAKQIPATLDMTLEKALEESPALKELQQNDPRVQELLDVARRLEGMTRHASVHAAGVVIAPRPLTEFVPLYKGQRGEITTQWAMKEIERVGLLKMDFLGLSTLTLLRDAVDEIRRTTGQVLDLDAIPLDDSRTYQIFCDGQTYGIFQFESSGMRDILRKAKPQRLDDLIALNALYRPGPLRSGMVDDFIARKHGKVAINYEVPQLEPVLADTYGVIAYQEQVMRIASELAGFSLGEADILRKAMGKKKADVMQAQRQKFVAGARKAGITEKKATKIFDLMEHFAGYGFNKSHSTAYAVLAYQTAFLKANYPWHFAAALLTIESQNTEKLALYLGECRERGIPVLPPDINESQWAFTVAAEGVRYGLAAVRNVGEGAVSSILDVRRSRGRIRSLYTLCEELDLRAVNKRVFESLVKAGAFDSLAPPDGDSAPLRGLVRARLVAAVDVACEHGARRQRDRDRGQGGLFEQNAEDGERGDVPDVFPQADVLAWTDAQQLAGEKEALGLYWSGHPIDRYAADLKQYGAKTLADLATVDRAPRNGNGSGRTGEAEVCVGGIVSGLRQLKTRKGDRMAVCNLEDPHGSVEVVVFPEAFSKAGALLQNDATVVVRGKLERDEELMRLLSSEVIPIEALGERFSKELAIRVAVPPHGRETFEALAGLFATHRGDRRVSLELELRGHARPLRVRAELASQVRIHPTEQLLVAVEKLCGQGSVSLR